jgi:hypothetical protein
VALAASVGSHRARSHCLACSGGGRHGHARRHKPVLCAAAASVRAFATPCLSLLSYGQAPGQLSWPPTSWDPRGDSSRYVPTVGAILRTSRVGKRENTAIFRWVGIQENKKRPTRQGQSVAATIPVWRRAAHASPKSESGLSASSTSAVSPRPARWMHWRRPRTLPARRRQL